MDNDNRRILAVKIDTDLFLEMKKQVKELGVTEQRFINDLIAREIEALTVQQTKKVEMQPKTLSRDDVEKAIEDFIVKTGRSPKQTEYKNENGLPSYGTASKCLGMSASLYGQEKAEELYESGIIDRPDEISSENPIMNF